MNVAHLMTHSAVVLQSFYIKGKGEKMEKVKLYEELAKEVVVTINEHRDATKKVADAVQKVSTDRRYTDEGKNQLIDGLRDELKENNQTYTKKLKDIINLFLNKYQVTPVDDAADSLELANALKIIEMCGYSLTAELLRDAVEPLKNSYKSMNMIRSIIYAKSQGVNQYSIEVLNLLDEYLGVNNDIIGYSELIDEIRSLLDVPELVSAGLRGTMSVQSTVLNDTCDTTPYCTLCLSDNMMKAGKMYEPLRLEYPRMFK